MPVFGRLFYWTGLYCFDVTFHKSAHKFSATVVVMVNSHNFAFSGYALLHS